MAEDKMFTQRQNALLSAVALLLLLTTAGQSAMVTEDLHPTTTPDLSNSTLTTQLINSSMEEPRVLRSHRSCGSEYVDYCKNGGECMFPQDNDKPFCICTSSYSGLRCMFFVDQTRSSLEIEQLIAISFGVMMFIFVLAIIIFCLFYKRCMKSAPLIKSAQSESSV